MMTLILLTSVTIWSIIPVHASTGYNDPRDPFTEKEHEGGYYHENGYTISSQSARPAINPDFAPYVNCLFDTFQFKCIPGLLQECPPPQFVMNDDATCVPKTLIDGEWKWDCPQDYHSAEYVESGQCYPDSEGCIWNNYVMRENRDGKGMNCEPVLGTNLNATIRCFVPDMNIDPGFVLNGTTGKIDPSFIRNDSSLINPCT